MEVQRIQTEATSGKRIDPVRNVERLWLEVEAVGNGCALEGFNVKGEEPDGAGGFRRVPTLIEVYADRLDAVLTRCRTDQHRETWKRAEESAAFQIENWLMTLSPKERARYKAMSPVELKEALAHAGCNHHPAQELLHLGFRTGLPPIERCSVIHPKTEKRMDARAFATLGLEAQREWFVSAPITPENASQRANESLAQIIAQAIAEGRGRNKG